MEEKYVFIKPYVCQYGTLPENSEIILFRGNVYFNGGLVPSGYANILKHIIEDENLSKTYLVKQKIIHNKI